MAQDWAAGLLCSQICAERRQDLFARPPFQDAGWAGSSQPKSCRSGSIRSKRVAWLWTSLLYDPIRPATRTARSQALTREPQAANRQGSIASPSQISGCRVGHFRQNRIKIKITTKDAEQTVTLVYSSQSQASIATEKGDGTCRSFHRVQQPLAWDLTGCK